MPTGRGALCDGNAPATLATALALRLDTDWFATFAPAFFEAGPETREILLDLIPDDFSWEGKRVMDFGCGNGRTLRHFGDEGEIAEVWGVDVDADALSTVERELCPPMHAQLSEVDPPLPFEDGSFDLIWAISVWTHLTDNSLPWLAEMHRILKPGGLLIPTYMGELHSELLAGEDWDEDRIGMNVLRHYQDWLQGAPMVLISDWWLREHWGRAFEVVRIEHGAQNFNWPVLRKRDVSVTAEDLARPSDDPREMAALRHNLKQVQRELEMALSEGEEHTAAERSRYEEMHAEFENSLSWRVTKPLRAARRLGPRQESE
jgi:SAM-dependent methyltransferase